MRMVQHMIPLYRQYMPSLDKERPAWTTTARLSRYKAYMLSCILLKALYTIGYMSNDGISY